MNNYESVAIINPNVDEETMKSLTEKFEAIINSDGKLEKTTNNGKKRLAYEINKVKEAYYVVFDFSANPSLIAELERNYRITDEVLKFIVIKKD